MIRDFIASIIGIYEPVTIVDTLTGVSTVPSGLAGVDFAYIGGLIAFLIILSTFCKVLIVLLRGS